MARHAARTHTPSTGPLVMLKGSTGISTVQQGTQAPGAGAPPSCPRSRQRHGEMKTRR